jgi:hypothetical protein
VASIEGIQAVGDSTPSLLNSPSLSLAAASSSDPSGTAETLAAGSYYAGAASALQQFQQAHGPGMYAGLMSKANQPSLMTDAGAALRVLNMPLQDVQHTYRYIRDVSHRHGWFDGFMATVGIAAGATVGGALGGFVGLPTAGAAIGGALAGDLEGHLIHRDSWRATTDPHYTINGHLVSPGRDLAGLLGFHHNTVGGYSGWGSVVSGLADAGFDWYTDPVQRGLQGIQVLRRSEQGLRPVLAAKWGLKDEAMITDSGNRTAAFLYRVAPGRGLDINFPEAPTRAYYAYPDVRRAINWIGKQHPAAIAENEPERVAEAQQFINDRIASVQTKLDQIDPDVPDWQQGVAAQELAAIRSRLEQLNPAKLVAASRITARFPELAPMAEALADTRNADETLKVFQHSLFNREMIARISRGAMPSATLMRAGTQRLIDKIADQDLQRKDEQGLIATLGQGTPESPSAAVGLGSLNPFATKYLSRKLRTFVGYAPYTMDRATQDLKYEFDPQDPNAAQGILRALKFGMGARQAELWTGVMTHAAMTGDTALAKKVWAEAMVENIKAMGLPDDPNVVEYVTRKARHVAYGEASTEQYTVGHFGGDSNSLVTTEAGTQHSGLYNYQRGLLAYPDFMRAKAAMRQLSVYTKHFGWLDDFAAEHYTNSFFKPLALVTMGFGLRIALNEAIIGASKYGNVNYVRAMVANQVAKHGYGDLVEGFKDTNYNESMQMIKAAASALGGWSKFIGADPQRVERALRLIAENDGHLMKGVVASGHSGFGVPDDAEGRVSQDSHYAIQFDRGVNAFQSRNFMVPSGSYEVLPFDHENFKDAYLSQLVRRVHERPAQLIAKDLRIGLAKADSIEGEVVPTRTAIGGGANPAVAQNIAERVRTGEGMTVNPYTGEEPSSGYIVSPYPEREHVAGKHGETPPDAAAKYIARNHDLLSKPGHHFGHYVNPDGNDVFDVVVPKGTPEEAEQAAMEHGQESYYDVEHDRVVTVNPEAARARWAQSQVHQPDSGERPAIGGESQGGSGAGAAGEGEGQPLVGEIVPGTGQQATAEAPRRISDERRLELAFNYAVHREKLRIEGIDPDTHRPYSEHGFDPYSYERNTVARYISQPSHLFAHDRVDDIVNLTVGRDGTVHDHLLQKISEQTPIARRDVAKIDVASLPRKVAGERMTPWTGPGIFQTAVQGVYKRMVDPVVNFLSREPLYFNAVNKHYDALLGAVQKGIIDDRDAFRFAQYRAANEMLPMIHNTALRSQFGLMVRNFMPFYFAQEQAYKRAGKAILDSPQVLRRWMLIENALHDPGFVHTDSTTGSRFLVFPGIGGFGQESLGALAHLGVPVVAGIPFTATGDLQSMQTVLPEAKMPGFSPMVSMPLNWLTSADPLLAPITKGVLGDRGFKENILSSVIPNAPVRNAILAATGDTNMSSFSNAYLAALASAYYHGELPDPATWDENPYKAQQAVDKIRNNARTLFAFKAILSAFSPLSPSLTTDYGLPQEYYKLLKDNGNVPGVALDEFLKKHGEKAIAFTVSHSQNAAGAYMPYTKEVQNYLQNYSGEIQQHPLAMAYLAPQSGTTGDVQVIHDELMRMAIKEQRAPKDFVEAIYQAQGERIYRKSQDAYYAAKGNYSNPLLTQQWTDWQQQFRIWNPVAYDYIKAPDRATRAYGIYRDLQQVYSQGIMPSTPQAVAIGALMDGYDAHLQQLAPYIGARDKNGQSTVTQQYHQSLVALAQQNPDLDSVIYNVFMHLDGVLEGTT